MSDCNPPVPLVEQLRSYPASCLHPYIDKNTGTPYPCGRCFVCRVKRQRILRSFMIEDLSENHCAMLVTLTYSPENVPFIVPLFNENNTDVILPFNDDTGRFSSVSINSNDFNKILHVSETFVHHNRREFDSKDIESVADLFSDSYSPRPNCFLPCFRYSDVQKFLKKLRRMLERQGLNSRVRYYCTAEYGSSYFRPHYHLLLFFADESSRAAVLEHESRALISYKSGMGRGSSLWTLGLSDWQYYSGGNGSYLTNYLTCSSNLPSIYRIPPLRQFVRRSNRIWPSIAQLPSRLFSDTTEWREVYRFFFDDSQFDASVSSLFAPASYRAYLPYVRYFNRFGCSLSSDDFRKLFPLLRSRKAICQEYESLVGHLFNIDYYMIYCPLLRQLCSILSIGLNQLEEAVIQFDAARNVQLPSVIENALYFISIHLRGFKLSDIKFDDYWRFVQNFSYAFDYYSLRVNLSQQETFFDDSSDIFSPMGIITKDIENEIAYYYPYTDTSILEELIPDYHPLNHSQLQRLKQFFVADSIRIKQAKHTLSHITNNL